MTTKTHKQIYIYTTPNELVKISNELKKRFNDKENPEVTMYTGGDRTLIFTLDIDRTKDEE